MRSGWFAIPLLLASCTCGGYPAGHLPGGGAAGFPDDPAGGGGGAAGAGLEPFDPSPVPLDAACETWALAQCRGEARCHEIPARFVDVCAEQLVARECYRRFEPDVREGRVRYDAAAWGRCLARLADEAHCSTVLSAWSYLDLDAECRAAFAGTVPAGEPCSSREWCAAGTCDLYGDCPSVCVRQGQEGEACTDDRDCGYPNLCEEGRCRGAGDVDARCTYDVSDRPVAQCRAGLFCSGGRCTPPLPEGATCEEYRLPCETGLRCEANGDAGRSCVRWPGPGEACDAGHPQPCRHDLYCNHGVCAEGKGPGEPCIAGLTPWLTGCALVFQCIEESFRSGHCGRGPGLGEACEENSYLRCEGAECVAGTCVGRSIPGYRCDEQHPCGPDACVDGFCVRSACAGG